MQQHVLKTPRSWHEIAEEVVNEKEPQRFKDLIQELIHALDLEIDQIAALLWLEKLQEDELRKSAA